MLVVSYVESTEDGSPLRVLPSPLSDLKSVERARKQRITDGAIVGAAGDVIHDEAADGREVARWYPT